MIIDSLQLNKLGEKYYLLSKIADKSFFTKDLKCVLVNKVTDGAKIHIRIFRMRYILPQRRRQP